MTDGSGVAERPLARPGSQSALAATPDGSGIVFLDYSRNAVDNSGSVDIWLVPLTGDRTPRLMLATEFTEIHPSVSLHEKWMAHTS